MNLNNLFCPDCGEVLIPHRQKIKPSNSYKECLRRCEKCGIGFSNNDKSPTTIYKHYSNNVPTILSIDLNYTLNNALNILNRENKKSKFAFSTSEDALTWSFFKYFVVNNKYKDLLKLLNIKSDDSRYEIYLWGVNISSQNMNTKLYRKLIKTSDFYNENPARRSEPDVIIRLSDKLIFIEVKYLGSNEVITNNEKFNKYLTPDVDSDKVVMSGHYELLRNWVIASKISNGANFVLINLGLNKLFADKNHEQLTLFENSLKTINGKFVKMSWEDIIDRMKEGEYESWFIEYLHQKI